MMAQSSERFRELLNEGLKQIHLHEGKPMRVIEDELGFLLGRDGGAAVQHWRKGRLPPHISDIEQLARAVATRGKLDRLWLEAFLVSAGHPAPAILCAELFPNVTTTGALSPKPGVVTANGLPLDPAQRLAAMPLRILPEPAPLPPGSRMPLSRNPLFVGRRQDLLTLAALLKKGATAAVHQVETAAATGLGGIGKTQLACEFVHRYGQYFAGGVFWISFENPEAISAEVAACGGAGGLNLRPDFAQLDFNEQVQLVRAAWQQPVPRLLVFDNCEDSSLLVHWRPTTGGTRILATSRRGEWETVLGIQLLPLSVLSRDESLALFAKHQVEAASEELDALAAELGDLPLALHLAGRYLHRYRRAITVEQYLSQLRTPALLQHPSFQDVSGISPTAHGQNVGRTFALSYEQLDDNRPVDRLARLLLVILAHFAPGEPLPRGLLSEVFAHSASQQSTTPFDQFAPDSSALDSLALEDGLMRLATLGLAEVDFDDAKGQSESQGGAIRLHRLVAAFCRAADISLALHAQGVVEQVVHDQLAQTNEAGAPRRLLDRQPHFRYVAAQALVRRDVFAATLAFLLARHLWMLGDFTAAHSAAEEALTLRLTLFGEAHLESAAAYHHLGIIEETQGALDDAEEHLSRALAIYLGLLGEISNTVADVLTDLGALLWSQRRVEEAIAHHRRALEICTQLPGADLVAAEAANNLATCLAIGLGDAVAARPYMEQSLAIRRSHLGEQHPFTALAYNNLGSVLKRMGELAAAQSHFRRALAIRREVLGDHHPDTAHSLITLGELLAQEGNLMTARTILQEAYDICRATVGESHELTVRAWQGLIDLE